MWHKPVLILSAVLSLVFFSGQSVYAEKIYKWTDNEGNIHYSDRPNNKEQSEEISVSPGPDQQATDDAKKRKQQQKSTADSLEKERQQREQQRTAEQKKRDAELAEEQARQAETPQGQNIDNTYPRYPRPPNYPRPHPHPPVAVPLPSGGSPARPAK